MICNGNSAQLGDTNGNSTKMVCCCHITEFKSEVLLKLYTCFLCKLTCCLSVCEYLPSINEGNLFIRRQEMHPGWVNIADMFDKKNKTIRSCTTPRRISNTEKHLSQFHEYSHRFIIEDVSRTEKRKDSKESVPIVYDVQ